MRDQKRIFGKCAKWAFSQIRSHIASMRFSLGCLRELWIASLVRMLAQSLNDLYCMFKLCYTNEELLGMW